MNCLPIVSRELRVAARKRSTFWLRVAAAVTGLIIGGACLVLSRLQGISTTQMGSALFNILIWLGFAAVICAGLFFTSDCLSEEKREGTLGLLFLTDLRGYDIALGKLAATSLRGVYAVLAILPILAVTQLMGGVTGAQYWKSALGLLNGLFVSLAAGLLISALSRDSQKALAGTLLLLLALSLGGVMADGIIAGTTKRTFTPLWCLGSPGYVLVCAGAWGRSPYWTALLVNQLLAWAMLILACALVPHAWQDRKRRRPASSRSWVYALKYGGPRRRRRRRRLLERYPMAWLVGRERWQPAALWTMAVVTSGGFVAALIWNHESEGWILWNYLGNLFVLILYLWAASQAARFLVEARHSGLLELLLATPLNEKQIVAGQWRALRRMFALPLLLLLSVHVSCAVLAQVGMQSLATRTNAAASAAVSAMNTNQLSTLTNGGTGTVTVSASKGARVSISTKGNPAWLRSVAQTPNRGRQLALATATATIAVLSTLGNLLALIWFGLWMGMTSRSGNLATLKTILFVQILPWFVISFAAGILSAVVMFRSSRFSNSAAPGDWMLWWPLLSAALATTAALAKDLGFILWARKKLYKSLRQQAAQDWGAPQVALPPPLLKPVAAPPVLPAPV